MKHHAPFHSFESGDPNLFAPYVELRRRVFHLHHDGLAEDFGTVDETDHVSRMVYVFRASDFAGGARLTISAPGRPLQLPLEECGFRVRDCYALRHLDLDRRSYAEISRMAIDPAFSHDLDASLCLAAGLRAAAADQGVETIFSICPAGAARLNRRNARALDVRFEQYSRIPTAYGRDMWLCAFTDILSGVQTPCDPSSLLPSASPASAGAWSGTSAA